MYGAMMVVGLRELSELGFGCYRVQHGSRSHQDALALALSRGCNLIDTAWSYGDGASERLVGDVLAEVGRDRAFVVTKGGYVPSRSVPTVDSAVPGIATRRGSHRLPDGSLHSTDPDLLEYQLASSRSRLRTGWVDAFLLHNPEYNAEHLGEDDGTLRSGISRSFGWLEEKVASGHVRYYGVSSNTLPGAWPGTHALSLDHLEQAAAAVSGRHCFRLIQFPHNLYECAATVPTGDGSTLVGEAARAGLITFANRPLNAVTPEGAVRLALYVEPAEPAGGADGTALMDRCLSTLTPRLRDEGIDDPLEIPILRFVVDNWRSLETRTAVAAVFRSHVTPMLETLYGTTVPPDVADAFAALERCADALARRAMADRTLAVLEEAGRSSLHDPAEPSSLAPRVLASYLASGLDHVLVGMRSTRYVDNLTSLLPGGGGAADSGA